jgi:hypothetical protein
VKDELAGFSPGLGGGQNGDRRGDARNGRPATVKELYAKISGLFLYTVSGRIPYLTCRILKISGQLVSVAQIIYTVTLEKSKFAFHFSCRILDLKMFGSGMRKWSDPG